MVVGDALQTLAHQVLLEAPRGVAAGRCLADATAAMIAGQADDIAFESRQVVSVEQCMAMCAGKTGALHRLGESVDFGAGLGAAQRVLTAGARVPG